MKFFLKKIFYPLSSKEYKNLLIIIFFSLFSAIFEILGIGLIIPILNIFVGNDYQNYIDFFPSLGDYNQGKLIKIILIIFIIIFIIKFIINIFLVVRRNKFSNELFANLSKKFFKYYLNKDYIFHIQNHSSILIRNVTHETNIYSFGIILKSITIISELIVFISISIFLLIYNFKASLFTIVFFSILSFGMYKISNQKLKKLGKIRQFHSAKYIKQLQQGFLSFREIIINRLHLSLLNKFSYHITESALTNKTRDTIMELPRFIFELIGVILIVLLFLFMSFLEYAIFDIIVTLGVFFYATIRLLPSISKILQSLQSIRFNMPATDVVYFGIKDIEKEKNFKKEVSDVNRINTFNKLEFKQVNYFYPGEKENILKNLNIKINSGDKIGLVGKTGSGKSTFVNLLCGMLKSSSGKIQVDEKPLYQILNYWQKQIGYVPQTVSIFDESILFNITLQENEDKVDLFQVDKILKLLDLDYFVNNLPFKLKEFVGENGAKLSGGQCQRLGIARALYKKPSLIILDEATNGLDKETEDMILEKLFINTPDLTIISISHKDNALKYCNRIFTVKDQLIKES
ncbi:ABC transporter ATP-binding protein/permease [Candidatus Pelagibacter sp.]|nr:ABC transporter ATP-binding protein/permease [Candidatus Pelagibacter sp.]